MAFVRDALQDERVTKKNSYALLFRIQFPVDGRL